MRLVTGAIRSFTLYGLHLDMHGLSSLCTACPDTCGAGLGVDSGVSSGQRRAVRGGKIVWAEKIREGLWDPGGPVPPRKRGKKSV